MARPREIKKRIGAVKTIQRITKTMQMIATAKFTSALGRAQAARPFTERINRLIGETLAAAPDFEHPLIRPPAESPECERLLVITSNRGLCGAYNANVLRLAAGHLRDLAVSLDLETAGKKAAGFFRFQRIPVVRALPLGDQPGYDEIRQLADRYIADFVAGRHDAVRVVSMHYVSNSRQVPRVVQILPLQQAEPPEAIESPAAEPLYDFRPSAEAILEDLMLLAARTQLFQAFLDAAVSEQIMRMVAMKAATDNARQLGRTLTRRFNRVRQAQITTELMEVIGGAAALG